MENNIKEIQKIPLILDVKEIKLTKKVKEFIGPELYKNAVKNSKHIFVYKINYKSKDKNIVGYMIEPRVGKILPCIIWNRGGSGDFGSIRVGGLFVGLHDMSLLAKKGYIIIATQYPGVAGGEGEDRGGGEDDIASILDLYKILKSYKRADSSRIGMGGGSRGGMMTYMCLARVKWIKAAVVISAPADEILADKFRKGWKEHQKKMYGGSKVEMKKRSAIYWTDKLSKKSPILLISGTADWRVNPEDSMRMALELHKNKIPFKSVIYPGADHGITEYGIESSEEMFNWFDKYVKNGEQLPSLKPHGK
jgi:dipeptidyl aminopeptidase/acylaminoacyl peptidase